ncbi:MAG: HAMP domain-containing histidine kinase [Deltaproteobacteria bacterium]|nr:HAMP domain-containing histidine kinase [Deltaproteobacteria bacterium]
MRALLPTSLWRILPWVQSLALVLLAGTTLVAILHQRLQLRADAIAEYEESLQQRVSLWEGALMERLDAWVDLVGGDPEHAPLYQVQLRQREPWLDSLYLWDNPRTVMVRGRPRTLPAHFLFPSAVPEEPTRQLDHQPCLARAQFLGLASPFDREAVVDAYLMGCAEEPLPVRLKAADDAAQLLLGEGQPGEALAALDGAGLGPHPALQTAANLGLAPERLVFHQLLRARALLALQLDKDAVEVLARLGGDISAQDAPTLAAVLPRMETELLPALRKTGELEAVAFLDHEVQSAKRRIRAWREIDERVLPSPALASEGRRFIFDQYSSTPFLLYVAPPEGQAAGVALQLDQSMLVAHFLASQRRLQEDIVVQDRSGRVVGGAAPDGPLAVQVGFGRSLSHLTVGITEAAVEERVAQASGGQVGVMVVVLLAAVLGLAATSSQVRNGRRQRELLLRQQEFATRVTHELKTPLAGIRVMAENIELGAYETPEALGAAARRVIEEADRLTGRVEEILSVTRDRRIPAPELLDPEEPVMEAVEHWAPRLDQAGVRLHADLDVAPQVMGDAASLRDAVGCLLDNALKYRREEHEAPQVWLSLREDGSDVVIEVADNGLGVPETMRASIFERFVRVEGDHRGKAGGHGLGLAQVRAIAEAHGGRVRCEEGVEGGARFVMRLPGAG